MLSTSKIQGVPSICWQLRTKFWKLKNHICQKVSRILKFLNKNLSDRTFKLGKIKLEVFLNWISKKVHLSTSVGHPVYGTPFFANFSSIRTLENWQKLECHMFKFYFWLFYPLQQMKPIIGKRLVTKFLQQTDFNWYS